MRRAGQLALLLFLGGLAASADAAMLVYEGFDYTVGQPVLGNVNPSNGQTYFQSGPAGRVNTVMVAGGNLQVPGPMPDPTGDSATINGQGNGASNGTADRLSIGGAIPVGATGATVYYSLAVRVDSLSGSNNTTGGFGVAFNNSTGAQAGTSGTVAAKLQMRIDPTDATKFNFGIFNNRSTGVAASLSWSPMQFDVGTTYFIVAAYQMIPGASNDLSHLWINPATATLGAAVAPAPTVSDTVPAGTDMGQVASILLRQSPAPFMTIDELRIGNTWADVTPVPEPGTWAMLLVGCAAMGAGVGFRKRGVGSAV
jgi:hypothetical protein